MGNCFKKEPEAYISVNESSVEKKDIVHWKTEKSLLSDNTFADTLCLDELRHQRRLSSLCIKPGEEQLYSKKINIDDFEIEKVIGKGGYGKVLLGKKIDTGKYYAIKEIKKWTISNDREKQNTLFERAILQNIWSPFVVRLHFAFQTPDKLYYVLDFCSGGELFFHLKKNKTFSEKKARFYIAECVLALEELHRNKIVYRDLKPENILLDCTGHVMLTDFGLSTVMNQTQNKCFTFAGTPEYLAPEIIREKGYSKEVDFWSLGAILYEMLAGVQPFHHANQKRLLDNILCKDLRMPDCISKDCKDLLKRLLERDPTKRLGHGDTGISDIKNHKFFKCINWEKLANKEIAPPFVPKIMFESDSRNFDKEFTSLRLEDTEMMPNRSIEEKKSTYIRDFTYYHPSGSATIANLDVEKLLENNLSRIGNNMESKFESIEEVDEGDEVSYIGKQN